MSLTKSDRRQFDALGYLRIKGAKSLEPIPLAILRELFLVRDARAQEIDRPPFKVLGNRTLLELVKIQPRNCLHRFAKVPPSDAPR